MITKINPSQKTTQTAWVALTNGYVIRAYVTESQFFTQHGAEVLHPSPALVGPQRTFRGTTYCQLWRTTSKNSGSIYGAYQQAYDWLKIFVKPLEDPMPLDHKTVPKPPLDPEDIIGPLDLEFKRVCRILRDATKARTSKLQALADLRQEAMAATRKL